MFRRVFMPMFWARLDQKFVNQESTAQEIPMQEQIAIWTRGAMLPIKASLHRVARLLHHVLVQVAPQPPVILVQQNVGVTIFSQNCHVQLERALHQQQHVPLLQEARTLEHARSAFICKLHKPGFSQATSSNL
jgi:hypothetical protein